MRALLLAAALVLTPAPLLAEPAQPEQDSIAPVNFEKTDPVMNAAIAEARRTTPEFLAVLSRPPAGARDFAFKYPLEGWEHIWVENVERKGNSLRGQLANVPIAEGYSRGQTVTVPISVISDWAWRDGKGVMQGHRTTRVTLPKLSPEDARALREYLGWTE